MSRFAGIDQHIAAGAAAAAGIFSATIAPTAAVSWMLSGWSLVGAILGGFVSVLISRDTGGESAQRQRAARWLGSSITGFLATPGVIRHFQISIEPDVVMGVAGAIAFVAWGALRLGQGYFNRWLANRLEQLAGPDSDPKDKP